MAAYQKGMAKFPVKLSRGPQTKLCSLFEELRPNVVVPPKQTQLRNSWISAPTWAQIDKRAALWQQGKLLQQTSCLIGRQIKAGLSGNRRQRAVTVVENIEMDLAGEETNEAWRCLKGWYRTASKQAPTASPMLLAAQTTKCVALYSVREGPLSGGAPPHPRQQSQHTGRRP